MAEHCKCASANGPAVIASTGCCERCGVQGSKREEAVRSALASGRHQLAADLGRFEGRREGTARGIEIGRLEVIEALSGGAQTRDDWEMGN